MRSWHEVAHRGALKFGEWGTKDAEVVRHEGARLRALVAWASFVYGDLRAIVSGTMDIGEMVRHDKARHRAHHMGFAVHCRGSDPVAFLGTVPLPTDAEHQGLKRGGQHQGRDSDPLVTWIYRAIAGGYPLRVGTVLAFRGT